MSAEFPSLAEVRILHRSVVAYWIGGMQASCECGWRGPRHNFDGVAADTGDREAAEHFVGAWREVCTIRTVQELDGLPDDSVVLLMSSNGGAVQKRYASWYWANDDRDGCWSEELEDFLPAFLIWSPDWAVS